MRYAPSLDIANGIRPAASEALSVEVAKYNIRVLIVAPGYFPTTNFISTASENLVRDDKRTGAYTDFQIDMSKLPRIGGDINKAAARIFEVVSGTGLGESFVREGKREWVRLPLGPDCGRRMRAKIQTLGENVDALEQVWSSTDMDADKIKDIKNADAVN